MSAVIVYIGDDQSERRAFRANEDTTARDIVMQICEKLSITGDQCFFAIFSQDSETAQALPLAPDTRVLEEQAKWSGPHAGRFTFKMLYYMAPADIPADPETRRFEFNQAKAAVLSGTFPLPDNLLLKLGGLALLEAFGPFKEKGKGFLKNTVSSLLPSSVLKSRRPEAWEELLMKEYKTANAEATDARAAYLSVLKDLPYYGMSLFQAKHATVGARRVAGKLTLGVSNRGIHFFDAAPTAPGGLTETHFWPYSSIFSWGRCAHAFAFTTDELGGARYTVETRDGSPIAAVVHGYVQLILFALAADKRISLACALPEAVSEEDAEPHDE